MPGPVHFHFDFISPYSYVASQLLERPEFAVPALYRPVVFGSMLSKLGVKGPGEIPDRRRLGLQDILLLCQYYGIPIQGPPTHPFNSLYALRSVCAVSDETLKARLTGAYFRAAWAERRALDDPTVLKQVLAEVGIDQDPEEVVSQREVRQQLKAQTRELLALGAWGVPSFVVDGLLFYGHDRLALLQAYLAGDLSPEPDKLSELLARPQPGRVI